MTEKKNYLIIGAGLSGICTALHLLQNGHIVSLIGSEENFSTAVAAGQINPLVFRRMTKSWRVDDFVPYAEAFYKKLEKESAAQLFYPIVIRRLFSSAHERELWIKKQDRVDFAAYMEKLTPEDDNYSEAKNDFGSGRIKNASFIHAHRFLTAGKEWIASQGNFVSEKVDYADIDPSAASYKGISYDGIVFCEGVESSTNPWFFSLPVGHTKGEVLTLHSTELPQTESLNRKCFLLPVEQNTFRLGATYVWDTSDRTPTDEGREELLDKLKMLTDQPLEVVDHLVGIRPTSPDRRPIIGIHPIFPKLSFFNGLGTKGYMIAPVLAKEFVAYLEGKGELDKEVRLERYVEKD